MSSSRKRNKEHKKVYDSAYYKKNVEHKKLLAKKHNANRSSEYQKNAFIKSKYGITLNEYNDMLKMQNGVCAICGMEETRKNRYTGICKLHIDHDHSTGKIRGLLCSKCNFGISAFKDNPDILMEAINYLNNQ